MRKRPIQHKLRSRKGATLTLALMLLLITSMLTAVVLSAAVTTAKRERTRKDTQQAILTLQSAVTMVRDQFTDSTAQIIEEKQKDGLPTISAAFIEGPLRSSSGGITQHPLAAASMEALKAAYQYDCRDIIDETPIPVGSFTVQAQVGDEELKDVNVSVKIRGNNHTQEESYMDFQIELVCTVEESSDQLMLKLDTDVYRSKSTDRDGNTTTTTVINWRPEGEA